MIIKQNIIRSKCFLKLSLLTRKKEEFENKIALLFKLNKT